MNAKLDQLPKFTEFETKYRLPKDLTFEFKMLMAELTKTFGDYSFKYVEGPDVYYTRPNSDSFIRYRKAINEKQAWVTMKEKRTDKSNINRKEVNWRVDHNDLATIQAGIEMMGYSYNFKIYKMCHIYDFKDFTLVNYIVVDENNKSDFFLEIELNEHTIHNYTVEEAYEKIRSVEENLTPLAVTYRNRLSKSLFEMYRKENESVPNEIA